MCELNLKELQFFKLFDKIIPQQEVSYCFFSALGRVANDNIGFLINISLMDWEFGKERLAESMVSES